MEASVPAETTLYEKLGGEVTIKAVVEEFYSRVLGDPALAPVFEGVDMDGLKRHQALFISQALGGPKQYEGRDMAAAHADLAVTSEQFDRVGGHLQDTLYALGVGEEDVGVIIATVASLKDQVVSAEAEFELKPEFEVKEDAPREPASLYEKLGGEATIKTVVVEFYNRVLGDPALAPVFEGVDMGGLIRHQALFISQALGGPKQYDGRDMAAAHAGLDITPGQFDAVGGHLQATLEALGVGEEDVGVIMTTVGSLKDQVVSAEEEAQAPASLYEKLGGKSTIKTVVEEFYKRVLGDPDLAPVFQGVNMKRLKRHQALFISQALGGPTQYDGRDMAAAHAGLDITPGQFDAVGGHLQATLEALGVEEEDVGVIMTTVGSLKEQVVSAEEEDAAAPQPEASPSAEPEAGRNLYEELGGKSTIKTVVEEFYKRVLADPTLEPMFQGANMKRLKRHQALFLSQVLGGPRQYEGRTMYQAHKEFFITADQFNAVAGHLQQTLASFGVAPADINLVLEKVAPLERDIVMTHFRRWLRGG